MGDSSVLVLHLVFPVEETMTHFVMCFQALSGTLGCSPAWMAAADEEWKSQQIMRLEETRLYFLGRFRAFMRAEPCGRK
jgi:hypothetical protein